MIRSLARSAKAACFLAAALLLAVLTASAIDRGDLAATGRDLVRAVHRLAAGPPADLAGDAADLDRQRAAVDARIRQLESQRDAVADRRRADAQLRCDLERVAVTRGCPLTRSQLDEALAALEACRHGDNRRLATLDRRTRELLLQRLDLLQAKQDLYDAPYRAALREVVRTLQELSEPPTQVKGH